MDTIDGGDGMFVPEFFDPGVQNALAGVDPLRELVDDVIATLPDQTPTDGLFAGLPGGVPGGTGTEELVDYINGGTADVSDLINDFLSGDLTGPGDSSSGPAWAPELPSLPDPALPGPVLIQPWLDPAEFALNGFPYQGQDPTEPGYYSLPTF